VTAAAYEPALGHNIAPARGGIVGRIIQRRASEQIAAQKAVATGDIAGLAPDAVGRFLVGGFIEVLRSWMEDPNAADLRGRVTAALDTVGALLRLPSA